MCRCWAAAENTLHHATRHACCLVVGFNLMVCLELRNGFGEVIRGICIVGSVFLGRLICCDNFIIHFAVDHWKEKLYIWGKCCSEETPGSEKCVTVGKICSSLKRLEDIFFVDKMYIFCHNIHEKNPNFSKCIFLSENIYGGGHLQEYRGSNNKLHVNFLFRLVRAIWHTLIKFDNKFHLV